MAVRDPGFSGARRLSDRLHEAREQRFVGRERDLLLFEAALDADEPPFAVLFLHGPGGVGKTALLDAFARIAAARGVTAGRIDGRAIEPSPASFLAAMQREFALPHGDSAPDVLDPDAPLVLLIDTYEQITPLDPWLREHLLPTLPSRALVVIAGRHPPAPAWRTEPGWGALVRVLPVRNLDPDESRAYLWRRDVPEAWHESVLTFTHGHPLALSLVADLLAQAGPEGEVPRIDDPDVVRVLLERFVEGAPGEAQRSALQLCAHVRVTTEALLAEIVGPDAAPELFAWLRGLSFIEEGSEGLFPHDLARDVLDADLRWRNPDAFLDLHRRARNTIVRRLQATRGIEQQRAFFDLLFLHRGNPLMRSFIQWKTLGAAWAEPATPADHPAIIEIVHRHEGDGSAALAAYWLGRQPGAFTVFRSAGRPVIGFVGSLAIEDVSPEDLTRDPAVEAAHDFVARHGPPRPGERLLHHRFAMGQETYQAASDVWDMVVMLTTVQWLTTPRLAWSFITVADPEYWAPLLAYVNMARSPEADFVVEGRRYAVFTHDWRAQPALAWLDVMAERELLTTPMPPSGEPEPAAPLIVLSEAQFREAVRQALRDYHRPEALRANPLMRSRLVAEAAGGPPDPATLRDLLGQAVAALTTSPRDERFHRALHHTYIAPAPSQETAAEVLGLPFSTFRSHLTTGIQLVATRLWQRELAGEETAWPASEG